MTTTVPPTTETDHPYLSGNYAPVREEVTATDLAVSGTIPDYLDGRYLRTGPNPLRPPNPERYHWFLGEGMAHGLRLRDGKAQWYRNRWIRSAAVSRELGETWPGGARCGGLDFAANTNIIGHGGRTLVLTESGIRPYELTDHLDTVGGSDLCGTLFGGYTAHPKRDPDTGELHAVSYHPMWGRRVQYTVTGTDGRIRRTVEITLDSHTMMHDFSLTERYVVIYDMPVVLDFRLAVHNSPARAASSVLSRLAAQRSLPNSVIRAVMRASERTTAGITGMPYRWAPEKMARIGVMPRDGAASDIRWFEVPQCYVFHPMNAFDDGDRVVLDVVRHPTVFTAGKRLFDPTTLDRWTVSLRDGRVSTERVDDQTQEFPRVDERRVGRRHRFGYAVAHANPDDVGYIAREAILRHDLVKDETRRVEFGPGREPGEFVFVPSSPDADEDDGVAMGFVYNRTEDRSDLVMVDGATLETVATVHLPVRVPHGFHGNWVPSQG
ncbi:carotenoid oxygenase family protein [Mycobacterium sp. AZCC_0083]|uniref:carotenoid oxygenase family protein n=1 Tax=Mycobacterium sp. AZCC_0083 TaxID=2735882 RepID=UPI00160F43A7|nr:carotenoid oxygenase family protein [Mycobacterium sp. AZCC_0083]MBB5167026.1 carotenoid cleavage dioxygenase [Mycobacterium sp. AZCC_0083]